MKQLTLTLALLFFSVLLFSQELDTLPQPLHEKFYEDYCPPPVLIAKAVINYEEYSKAYLEFELSDTARAFRITAVEGEYSDGFYLTENEPEILITDLPPNELFDITTIDTCGDTLVVAQISTVAEDTSAFGIEVSNRMYHELVEFQRAEDTIPLMDYLEELNTVSPYEKISFVQQYFFDGEVFTTDEGTDMPSAIPPPPPNDSCRCDFVLNTPVLASPGFQMNGTIKHFHEESHSSNGIKIPFNSDSRYWWFRNTTGAAKWHYAWSEGWKAGGDHQHYHYSVVDSNLVSPHMAVLGYNFFCTNYPSQVPRECKCTKKLLLYYRYDSRVVASAKLLGSSINDRSSEAISQDIGVVALQNGDELEILDAGDIRAEAECDSGINDEWFVEYADVVGDVLQAALVYMDTTGMGQQQLQALIDSLINSIQDLIGTPIYDYAECEAADIDGTLALSTTAKEVEMFPNKPVYLYVFSFTNQRVGGKRKWFSYAGVQSDFYLAGIIPGGRVEGGSEACCTEKKGNWVLASLEGPNSVQDLKNQVGFQFGIWKPWNLPVDPLSEIVMIPTEYGITSIAVECDELSPFGGEGSEGLEILTGETVAQTHPVPVSPSTESETKADIEISSLKNIPSEIIIFDLSGRLLYRGKEAVAKSDLQRFMVEKNLANTPGIYFVHFVRGNQRETVKVFVIR